MPQTDPAPFDLRRALDAELQPARRALARLQGMEA